MYLEALSGGDFKELNSEEEERKVNQRLKIPCLNNIAVCLLKQKEYGKAIAICD